MQNFFAPPRNIVDPFNFFNTGLNPFTQNLSFPLLQRAITPLPMRPLPFPFLEEIQTSQVSFKEHFNQVVHRSDLQELRSELAKRLNDIERVDKIVYDYATIVKDKIPFHGNQKHFEQWMIGIAYFLGSPYYDHNLFFKHQSSNPFFSTDQSFKLAFNDFSSSIQKHANPLHKTLNTAKKVKNITILYPGSGGGGHKAPATAMAKSLEEHGHHVKLLDTDEFERPYDPKIGGLTRGEIFTKIYQQEGNKDKAYQMWAEADKIQPIEARRHMKDLSNTIRELDTDHLFVVAHHQPEHASLAYQLGIPTSYVHTDNEFHLNLLDLSLNQQEIARPLVNFTSLSNQSDFFHSLLDHEGKSHYNQLPNQMKNQMLPMNFPVRQSFQPVSKQEKMRIRAELGISRNATVVKLAMGANGIPKDIKDIMRRIKEEGRRATKPIHVLVVCGSNEELKKELDSMTAQDNRHGGVKFQILGFLNEQEMAQFDQASDVWITKPGGSTSAEAQQMKKQMLYVPNPHHWWELTNARVLERQNLAEQINFEKSLISQINKRAAIGESVEYAQQRQEPWSHQLARIVDGTARPLLMAA